MCEVMVLFDGYSKRLNETTMDANCSCTLIKGPKLIIVDTMTAWDREKLLNALAQHNVSPTDVDYVVCTHGHSDHIGNNNLFTNAEHIVGFTVHHGTMFFEKNIIAEDYELCPGVKVIATPGHTAEDVTVIVETIRNGEKTCFAITGDLFEKEEDILSPHIWRSVGAPELLESQYMMRQYVINLADFIIPGHGPMFRVTDDIRKIINSQQPSQ
ncbi:metallo-beta-lactamase domain-containing protein 1 [Harpegnathos saltator]|uniref:Metallo-beta-lactamase domain-containing protein 1 n=1 Tax=Harpegnathos saltator TaxID=610380 RepID=E2C9B9_HARSA|nr:metallo-beta-lactamase domain-containing protein 1 [Harpegnathos saltator]EFN75464.1 Beta-lactamase-like protein LOC255374-like protein [Harpegnathos saltator]